MRDGWCGHGAWPALAGLRRDVAGNEHVAALLGTRRVGAELVGSSHRHRSWCPNVGRGPGCWRRRATACDLTARYRRPGPGYGEGRERGFLCRLEAAVPPRDLDCPGWCRERARPAVRGERAGPA